MQTYFFILDNFQKNNKFFYIFKLYIIFIYRKMIICYLSIIFCQRLIINVYILWILNQKYDIFVVLHYKNDIIPLVFIINIFKPHKYIKLNKHCLKRLKKYFIWLFFIYFIYSL